MGLNSHGEYRLRRRLATPSVTLDGVESGRRKVGRPSGPHGDTLAKLLPVALRLFLEEGGAALTPTRLHKETGLGRPTIYRNWPEPADLVELLLEHATEQPSIDRFVGDLGADLDIALEELLERFDSRPASAFFSACIEYGRRSPRVASAGQAYIAGILGPFRLVIERAVERGELEGEVDELLSDLTGPLILDHIVLRRRVSKTRGRSVVHAFLKNRA